MILIFRTALLLSGVVAASGHVRLSFERNAGTATNPAAIRNAPNPTSNGAMSVGGPCGGASAHGANGVFTYTPGSELGIRINYNGGHKSDQNAFRAIYHCTANGPTEDELKAVAGDEANKLALQPAGTVPASADGFTVGAARGNEVQDGYLLTIIFPQTAEGKCTVSVLDQRQWGGCIDVEIPPQTTTPTPPTTTLPPINGFPQLCPAAACGVTDQLECRRPFPLNVCASILTVPGGKKCPNDYNMCTTKDPCGLGDKLNEEPDPALEPLGCYITTTTTTVSSTTTTTTLPNHQSGVYTSTGKVPARNPTAGNDVGLIFRSTCTDNAPNGTCCCVLGLFTVNVAAMTVDITATSECDLHMNTASASAAGGGASDADGPADGMSTSSGVVPVGALGNTVPIKPPKIDPGAAEPSILELTAVPLIRVGPILKVANAGISIGGQDYIVELSQDLVHFTNVGTDTPLFCDGFAPIDDLVTLEESANLDSGKKKGRGGRVFLGLFLTALILACLYAGFVKQTTGSWPFVGTAGKDSQGGAAQLPHAPARPAAPPPRPLPPAAESGYLEPVPVADSSNYEVPTALVVGASQYSEIDSHGNAMPNETYTGAEVSADVGSGTYTDIDVSHGNVISNQTYTGVSVAPVAAPRPSTVAQYDNAAPSSNTTYDLAQPTAPARAPPPRAPPTRPSAPPGQYIPADSNA